MPQTDRYQAPCRVLRCGGRGDEGEEGGGVRGAARPRRQRI